MRPWNAGVREFPIPHARTGVSGRLFRNDVALRTPEGSMSAARKLVLALAALLAAAFAVPAVAQDAPDIAGTWSGAVAVPTGDLRLVLYVERGADGSLKAKIESFDQNPG